MARGFANRMLCGWLPRNTASLGVLCPRQRRWRPQSALRHGCAARSSLSKINTEDERHDRISAVHSTPHHVWIDPPSPLMGRPLLPVLRIMTGLLFIEDGTGKFSSCGGPYSPPLDPGPIERDGACFPTAFPGAARNPDQPHNVRTSSAASRVRRVRCPPPIRNLHKRMMRVEDANSAGGCLGRARRRE